MQRSDCNSTESASSPRRFVVYGLIDPRDGSVRYIGVTRGNPEARWAAHWKYRTERRGGGSVAKRAWLAELAAAGLLPLAEVVERFDSAEEMKQAERRWIHLGVSAGWPLTNIGHCGRPNGTTRARLLAAIGLASAPLALPEAA